MPSYLSRCVTDGCCSAAIEYIHAEDEQTNYIDIGPVNKAMNMLCVWIAAGGAADGKAASSVPAFQSHLASKRETHALMPKASTSADTTPVHLRSARLPVGGRGRAENARVQWQPVLGHVLRAAGCLRSRLVWRAAANGGQGVALPGEDANFEYRRKLLDGGHIHPGELNEILRAGLIGGNCGPDLGEGTAVGPQRAASLVALAGYPARPIEEVAAIVFRLLYAMMMGDPVQREAMPDKAAESDASSERLSRQLGEALAGGKARG